jgi:hypothetical protein
MLSLAIFGGSKIDGSELEVGERLFGLALFGGIEVDFSAAPPAPAVEIVVIALFGGVTIRVRPQQAVRLTGFSLFSGRDVDPRPALPDPVAGSGAASDDEDDLPLEVRGYALFGALRVTRTAVLPHTRSAST